MKNKELSRKRDDDGLPLAAAGILERFLSAIRGRDKGGLDQLAAEASSAAREARAGFVRRDGRIDSASRALGAIEVMEALTVRASQRHARNAQFEAMQRSGACALLIAVGRSEQGVAFPKQLVEQLPDILPPNISRLVRELRAVGLLADPEDAMLAGVRVTDGRTRPMCLTPAAETLLDQLNPGWREVGYYGASAPEEQREPESEERPDAEAAVRIFLDLIRSHAPDIRKLLEAGTAVEKMTTDAGTLPATVYPPPAPVEKSEPRGVHRGTPHEVMLIDAPDFRSPPAPQFVELTTTRLTGNPKFLQLAGGRGATLTRVSLTQPMSAHTPQPPARPWQGERPTKQ